MKKLFLTSQGSVALPAIVPLLDRKPAEMRVAFVPTASRLYDSAPWHSDSRAKLVELGFDVVDVDIAEIRDAELTQILSDVDLIFVGGGNTFYLLQESRKSGFDRLVTDLVNEGTVYIGSSAGSVLCAPTIEDVVRFDDPYDAPELTSYTGLGLVDFIPLVHLGSDEYKEAYVEAFKDLYTKNEKYILLNDRQFVSVVDDHYTILAVE